MMILVLLFLTIYSFVRYRQAVLLCASSLLFMPNWASGIPNVKLLYIISMLQVCLFYLKGYYKKKGHSLSKVVINTFTYYKCGIYNFRYIWNIP